MITYPISHPAIQRDYPVLGDERERVPPFNSKYPWVLYECSSGWKEPESARPGQQRVFHIYTPTPFPFYRSHVAAPFDPVARKAAESLPAESVSDLSTNPVPAAKQLVEKTLELVAETINDRIRKCREDAASFGREDLSELQVLESYIPLGSLCRLGNQIEGIYNDLHNPVVCGIRAQDVLRAAGLTK
jgi:hypothetical protein